MKVFEIIQDRIGYELPQEYRRFVEAGCKANPLRDTFSFKDATGIEDESMLHEWYYADDLIRKLDVYLSSIQSPMLPIACDPGGNQICLNLETGQVFLWDHEREFEYYLLASTFNLFLNEALYIDDEDIGDTDDIDANDVQAFKLAINDGYVDLVKFKRLVEPHIEHYKIDSLQILNFCELNFSEGMDDAIIYLHELGLFGAERLKLLRMSIPDVPEEMVPKLKARIALVEKLVSE